MPPIVVSSRGREVYHHEGFLFHFISLSVCGTKKFWKCVNKRTDGCTARLHTSVKTGEVLPTIRAAHLKHNHAPDPAAVELLAARSTIKLLVAEATEYPQKLTADAVLAQQGIGISASTKLVEACTAVKRVIDKQYQRKLNPHYYAPAVPIPTSTTAGHGRDQGSSSSAAVGQASWDFNSSESFGDLASQSSSAKRFKQGQQDDPAEVEVLEQLPSSVQQFHEQQRFIENQMYPETYEEYGGTSQEGFPIEQYTNDDASPQMCIDSVTSNSDDILTTLVRNQQLMLDAMQRLESKLDSVQHDFNMRLIAVEKQTHEVTKQIQRSFNSIEKRLDNFIAANDSYSNPDPDPATKEIIERHLLATRAVGRSIDHANSTVGVSSSTRKRGSEAFSSKNSGAISATASTTSCLLQCLESPSTIVTRHSQMDKGPVVGNLNNKVRPGVKLHLDPQDSGVGWIGGNPKLAIPVSEYLSLLSKSEGSALQLLFALLLQTCSGPNNLQRLLLIDKDGRRFFKQDLLFDSCVTQVCLQFPAFQMNNSISLQLAERIAKLCESHTAQQSGEVTTSTAACGVSEIPINTLNGEGDETDHEQIVLVKEEVGELWEPS